MADLARILERVLPLNDDGSLPDPITRSELERRVMSVSYPRPPVNGYDTALITGSIQALQDFALIRFTSASGGFVTRAGDAKDLCYRQVTDFGPPATGFGPPKGHGTKETLIDEHGKAHDFHIGAEADAERARIQRVRRNAYMEQLKADMAEVSEV